MLQKQELHLAGGWLKGKITPQALSGNGVKCRVYVSFLPGFETCRYPGILATTGVQLFTARFAIFFTKSLNIRKREERTYICSKAIQKKTLLKKLANLAEAIIFPFNQPLRAKTETAG